MSSTPPRRAPPRDDEPRTFLDSPVSAGTCALAIGITALYWAGKNIDPLTMSPEAFGREPWRLFTSALVHAHFRSTGFTGIFHLLFNVAWTFRLGGRLETRYGSLLTLLLFLVLAAGSSAAEYAIFRGGIGLSGVGFGLFGFLWVASKRTAEFDDVIDRRVIAGFVGWFFFCIVSTYFGALQVANVAHGMGCLLGALAGAAATAKTPVKRGIWFSALAAALGLCVAGGTVLRPMINVDYALETAETAYALVDTDPARAADLYRRALKRDPKSPNFTYLLGVALVKAGRRDEAEPLFAKACELAGGSDERYCH